MEIPRLRPTIQRVDGAIDNAFRHVNRLLLPETVKNLAKDFLPSLPKGSDISTILDAALRFGDFGIVAAIAYLQGFQPSAAVDLIKKTAYLYSHFPQRKDASGTYLDPRDMVRRAVKAQVFLTNLAEEEGTHMREALYTGVEGARRAYAGLRRRAFPQAA